MSESVSCGVSWLRMAQSDTKRCVSKEVFESVFRALYMPFTQKSALCGSQWLIVAR